PAEKLVCTGTAAGPWLLVLAVKEKEVDIAAVIQLLAAVFAEGQHRAGHGLTSPIYRQVETAGNMAKSNAKGHLQRGVGHRGQVRRPIRAGPGEIASWQHGKDCANHHRRHVVSSRPERGGRR